MKKKEVKIKQKDYFKYVVLAVVLLIPFIYSFFYLKAYWNPYGEGNIDNLPVAIVNEDEGDKGLELINSIKESKKLKLSIVDSSEATDGLNNQDYYAVITIPSDFTSSMESVSTTNKVHPTITYSPNQKANYLASQIINSVVNAVEKNLDNSINSAIVEELTDKLNTVPSELEEISSGFSSLDTGVTKLKTGAYSLQSGTKSLKDSYALFNAGLKTLNDSTTYLNEQTSNLSSVSENLTQLVTSIDTLKTSSDKITTGTTNYVSGVDTTLTFTENAAKYIIYLYEIDTTNHSGISQELYVAAKQLTTPLEAYGNISIIDYLKLSGTTLDSSNQQFNTGISTLNEKVSSLSTLTSSITELQQAISQLQSGTNTLYENSLLIEEGINTLSTGTDTLTNGIDTLSTSVKEAKSEIDDGIDTTKEELKTLEGLSEYSEEPVTLNTETVNEISSYGVAFSPLFISIGLWIGCLMMYIVLYYDKEERFKILSISNENKLQRTLTYHGLITLSAIILGIILQLLLDFDITNIFLYYVSIILIANAFMAIIEFLIVNFSDVGKFLALIILVLQLAAAGGTFPIETVTKGFRFLNSFLPMTYAINLLKEALVVIEGSLLTKNLLIVIMIFIVFFGINIVLDITRQKKLNK